MFELLFKYPRDVYERSDLVYATEWPQWLIVLLVVVATGGILTLLYRRRRTARLAQLTLVFLLQAAMLAAVVWILLQPALRAERIRDGENSVAFLLDTSGSMGYGETRPRIETAMSSLSAALDDAEAPELATRFYTFDAGATPVDSFVDARPDGEASALAASITTVLQEARYGPLAAVVLASDGADTSGGISFEEMNEIASFGVPVHAIAVGRESMREDLELSDVLLPQVAMPGSTISARVAVRHDAAATTRIKVYDGDELLASEPLTLRADASTTTAWIDFEIPDAGYRHLEFALEAGAEERELRNNSRTRLIEVAEQDYRILYFEGEPRWEYKFLRRAVAADPHLRIVSLLRVSPNKFYRQGLESPQQLEDGFPTTRDELFGYDALIIGSVEAASMTPAQLALIRDFVSVRGGSLLMLAGPNGLGNGGWGQSELADVLPTRLPSSNVNSFFRRQAMPRITPQGNAEQMLRFSDAADANVRAWSELPAVADYQLTGELKPAASALLSADTQHGELPLLVTQPFGRGHCYILASGGTWRWQMRMPLEDQRHEIFWRQLLRGLVATTPEPSSLAASGDADDTTIALRAEFRDEAFREYGDVRAVAVVSNQDGGSLSLGLQPSATEAGVYHAEFEPAGSSTFFIEAVAEQGGEPIAAVRTGIHYESGRAEYFNLRRNTTELQRLAEATGGRFLEPHEIDALPDLLRYSSAGVTELEYRAIWDAPAVFLFLILLKAGEWLLRRRWSSI